MEVAKKIIQNNDNKNTSTIFSKPPLNKNSLKKFETKSNKGSNNNILSTVNKSSSTLFKIKKHSQQKSMSLSMINLQKLNTKLTLEIIKHYAKKSRSKKAIRAHSNSNTKDTS